MDAIKLRDGRIVVLPDPSQNSQPAKPFIVDHTGRYFATWVELCRPASGAEAHLCEAIFSASETPDLRAVKIQMDSAEQFADVLMWLQSSVARLGTIRPAHRWINASSLTPSLRRGAELLGGTITPAIQASPLEK